jgi:hypothetical protein
MINSIKIFCIFVIALGGFVTVPLLAYSITVTSFNTVTMNEIFKPIKGYEGLYEVSNLGNVKSLERYVNNKHNTLSFHKELILKNVKDNNGYYIVGLHKNGMIKNGIHRLVAESFIPNPGNKKTVNHKNGIKTDNRVENLEWATYSENTIHSYKNLLQLPNKSALGKFGKYHNRSKSVLQCSKDGLFIKEYGSQLEAERNTNIDGRYISLVCNNKRGRKTAGGYIWKFKV